MIKDLLCRLLDHSVDRGHVWNDGYDYRTECRRCGAPLIRDPHGWRAFDEARDGNLPRKPHPHDRAGHASSDHSGSEQAA